ncbi:MAG: sigma-70 family RNA polymerase sigma factor [Verrucomicrobiota bacterium]
MIRLEIEHNANLPTTDRRTPCDLTSLSDEDLVTRCQADLPHQLDSYDELVRRYRPLFLNYCARFVGNQFDAEEICQDVFVRIFKKIGQFEGRSSFKTWAFRIASNLCLNHRGTLAKKRERYTLIQDEYHVQADAIFHDAGTEDLAETIQKALARLDDQKRELMNLRFVSGLRIEEIADRLGLKLSAAKMRIHRARAELKDAYLDVLLHEQIA